MRFAGVPTYIEAAMVPVAATIMAEPSASGEKRGTRMLVRYFGFARRNVA